MNSFLIIIGKGNRFCWNHLQKVANKIYNNDGET